MHVKVISNKIDCFYWGIRKVTIGITGLLWPSVDMVARLKLKQIYGRAPKGIKLVAQFNQTWEFY